MAHAPGTGPAGTSHAVATYIPEPKTRRQGLALCLSGGGFRATLFHLGALRRLNELGVLARLTTVSTVSGGSILAAYLARALPWPLAGPVSTADWNERVAQPIKALTRRNLRTGPLLRALLPWNWWRPGTAVTALAARYRQYVTARQLGQLPQRPRFLFNATDMAFGVNWIFTHDRMGDYQAGYVTPHQADWPVADAVAASSCFPPLFNPFPLPFRAADFTGGAFPAGPARECALSDLRLTDGGVYDNLGLEPVWKTHAVVLVSDGGGTFDAEPDPRVLWQRLTRYTAIVENQARALRKRWLIASFLAGSLEGAYWGISSARSSYDRDDAQGYDKALASTVIAEIRTDLDPFSEAEAAVLENHGYGVADAAVQQHARELPTAWPALVPPHPEWLDATKVRAALATSHRRAVLGRRGS